MTMIDNTRNVYTSLKLRHTGMRVHCRHEVIRDCPTVLFHLDQDLRRCLQLLPSSVQPLVRRTHVWVNHTYLYGSMEAPEVLNHTTAHHHAGWLIWARDLPEKVLGIEIYSAEAYLRMRNHWNGCGLILHELCHLIHQQVLGLDCALVKSVYEAAERTGKYETVLRRDWAGKPNGVDTDLSYSMVDHKEFFAEMSVTYWSRGYQEMDGAPCEKMEECCPPITEPTVLARIVSTHPNLISKKEKYSRISSCLSALLQRPELPHCNKFYPFTSGQLRHYDPELFDAIDGFWREIAAWEDPIEPRCYFRCWKSPLGKWSTKAMMVERVLPDEEVATVSDTVDL